MKQEKEFFMRRTVRLMCIFLAVCLTGTLIAEDNPPVADWSKTEIVKNRDGQIFFRSGKRWVCNIFDWNKRGLAEAKVESGTLLLDSTRFPADGKNKGPVVTFNGIKPHSGKVTVVELELSADSAGKQVEFFYTGTTAANRSFHRQKTLVLTSDRAVYRVEQLLPANLKQLQFRLDFPVRGVYRIGAVRYGLKAETAVDSSVNHIPNGGAERGFYGVMPPSRKRFAGTMPVHIDNQVFFRGKRSFRLEGKKGQYNRLVFNSVPYAAGKPAAYSVWMKALAPTRVELMLFVCSSNAYIRNFNVGTEWKKYTLSIPTFGEKEIPGVKTVGNPLINLPLGMLNPTLTLPRNSDSVVWVDQVSYQLAEETAGTKEPAVWISGRLNRGFGCYPSGEAIRAAMKFEPSGDAKTASVRWKLLDWQGKPLAESPAETITLPLEKEFVVPSPDAQGPMNLVFEVAVPGGKRILTHNFYCGVISPSRSLNRRIGVNTMLRNPEQAEVIRTLLREFGVGAIRVWSHSPGAGEIRRFHRDGFYILFCLAFPTWEKPGPQMFFLPRDYSTYLKGLTTRLREYSGAVDAYEIFNEPNIWSGRSKNPDEAVYRVADPAAVAEGTGIIADCIRRNDPQVKIAGPACCSTSVSYIESYLRSDGGKRVDIVTEHPYRELPEAPDYAAELASLKKVAKRSGSALELQATESGSVNYGSFPGNRIIPSSVDYAAQDIRLAIIGLASGVKRFYQFSCGGHEVQNAWTVLTGSGPDGSGSWQPGPWLYAAKTAGEMIGENATAATVKMGFDSRCYMFDHGNRRVAALWKWHGAPVTLKFPYPVEYREMMGSCRKSSTVPLSDHPVYLVSTLDVKAFGELIRSAMPETSAEPVRFSVEVLGPRSFGVKVRNMTAKPLSGRVEVAGFTRTQEFRDLPGEESAVMRFSLPQDISTQGRRVSVLVQLPSRKLTREFDLKAILVPYTDRNITVDGDLSDWPANARTLRLDFRNAYNRRKTPWSDEAKRSSAEVKFAWNSEYLYLAVVVKKQGFYPESIRNPWMGDGLQLAFDTIRNAVRETAGYQDDDFEYIFWRNNGVPQVWRSQASVANYDSLPKPLGIVSDVKFAIRRTEEQTVYEMAFPPFSISPFKLVSGSACRFNLIVNLNDGRDRIGWLEIAPGIGQSPKRPGIFPDLVLIKEGKNSK